MRKVNACLYWSYITVTAAIGIISVLLLGLTLLGHGVINEMEEMYPDMRIGIYLMYGIAIIPLIFVIIGLVGAHQKQNWALIVFAVGMSLASAVTFIVEVEGLAGKSELAEENTTFLLNVGPLVKTSDYFQETINEAQAKYQCCGLHRGYVDWDGSIPKSCLCTDRSSKPCVSVTSNSLMDWTHGRTIMVYEEPCLQYLNEEEVHSTVTVIGVMMAVTFLWVLSTVLCIVILCQMNRKEDTSAVV